MRTSWEGCTPPDAFPHDGENVWKAVFVAVRRDSLVTDNLINLCLCASLDVGIMQDCEEECRGERDDLNSVLCELADKKSNSSQYRVRAT